MAVTAELFEDRDEGAATEKKVNERQDGCRQRDSLVDGCRGGWPCPSPPPATLASLRVRPGSQAWESGGAGPTTSPS